MAKKSITPKFKNCAVCETPFQVWKSTQKVCSGKCALVLVRDKAKKEQEKENRKAVRELRDNDRSFQVKKTQELFNRYIRLRDRNDPCISCQRHHAGQYHAGHYRSVGANPALRFDEGNCHKQCSTCNNHLSGNLVDYRINLIKKMGLERVEILEGPHEPKRYTISRLKELQVKYRKLIKEIELNE